MSKTMKAALIRAFGEPLTIDEVPTPEPGASQVLVRIVATGVCHTDLHAMDGDWAIKPEIPLIPGHEGVGYVAALGAGVTSLKEGDRVGVFWLNRTCGHCEFCLSGREMICPKQVNTGFATNGTYADYVLADADYVRPIPEDADFAETAPVFCAGLTTYKGLKQTEALPGQWVAVLGAGGLGHLAVQYARAMGYRVIALVTAPAMAAFAQGLGVLRRGGTCVMNGLPDGEFPVAVMGFVQKGLTVRGALVGSRQDLNEALEFVAQGKVRAAIEVEPFERVNEVLDRLRRGEVKGRAVLKLD
jgi:propanol-preferring alcohol dehydrogenase